MQTVFDGHNDVLYRLWNNASKGADPVAEFIQATRLGPYRHAASQGRRARGRPVRHLHHVAAICRSTSPTRMGTTRRRWPSRSSVRRRSTSRSTWRRSRCASSAPAAGRSAATPATSRPPPPSRHSRRCCIWRAARRSAPTLRRWRFSTPPACGRSGPVWSRNNIFAHGVPFAFPMSPDTGPGLTDAGKRLVARVQSAWHR